MRLRPSEWVGLWWQGRVDARRGLPRLPQAEEPQMLLPQVEAIRRHALEVCEFERVTLLADLRVLEPAARAAADRARTADDEVARAERRLAEFEATGPAEDVRLRGEEHLNPLLVARRRAREFEKQVEQLRQDVLRLREVAQRVVAEADAAKCAVRTRREQARVRVLRYVGHAERRTALYWRSLIRRHRSRHALNERWALLPVPVPAWIDEEGIR